MAKITVEDLRKLFGVDSAISDERLEFCVSQALRQIKTWVGDTAFNDASSLVPVDVNRSENLRFAAAHLAMYYALLNTGVRIRKNGVVKREQDAGGSVTNNVVNEFMTSEELQDLRNEYFQTAQTAASPYLPGNASGAKPKKAGTLTMRGGWARDFGSNRDSDWCFYDGYFNRTT